MNEPAYKAPIWMMLAIFAVALLPTLPQTHPSAPVSLPPSAPKAVVAEDSKTFSNEMRSEFGEAFEELQPYAPKPNTQKFTLTLPDDVNVDAALRRHGWLAVGPSGNSFFKPGRNGGHLDVFHGFEAVVGTRFITYDLILVAGH